MLVFFGAKSLGHDVGQIVIGGNVSEVDNSVLLPVTTDVVPDIDLLGFRLETLW